MTGEILDSGSMTALETPLPDLTATEALAAHLAPLLRVRDTIALAGDLGAGKTAFSRALIRTLGDRESEVPSPTFTLVQTYELPAFTLWHFDLYRLDKPEDALELDIEDAFASGVSLIEWPDRLGPYLPADRLDLLLTFADREGARQASLRAHGSWTGRMGPLLDG